MACFRPLKAYRASGGKIVFNSKEGFGDLPLELPCGQCVGCRAERSRQWALRVVHEAQMSVTSSFVTLTYSDANLPSDGGLCLRDWQLFAKRLRKRAGPFRYFMCGEYGESTLRPHFHACIFGLDFRSGAQLIRSGSAPLWTNALLEDSWKLGLTSAGALTYQSANYVARYVMKKATGAEAKAERYGRVDARTGEYYEVRPEFVAMSRRPGVGSTWFDKFHGDVFPRDEVVHDGKRFRPPRFYDSKLPEAELEGLKVKRRRRILSGEYDRTPARLRVREEVAIAKLEDIQRRL